MAFVYRDIIIGNTLKAGTNGHVVTTTKGDLITDNGTQSVRLPVGNDGFAIVANSAVSTGLEWRQLLNTDVGLGNVQNTLNAFNKTTNPTVNDDASLGYSRGSVWLNTAANREFVLFDSTNGAAVWVESTTVNYIAGNGLVLTGNTLDVVGSSTILSSPDTVSVNSSAIANQVILSAGTVGQSATYGALPLGNSNSVSGILTIPNGGTGASSFTTGSRLISTNAGNTALVSTNLDPTTIVTLTGAQTLTNKSLTTPIITTSINDSNSNELITLTPTANAVNQIAITNAATGTSPSVNAVGDDTNINLLLNGKGTGAVSISGNAFPTTTGSAGQVLTTNGSGIISYSNVQLSNIGTVTTTNATPTTIPTVTIPTTSNTAYFIRAKFLGRETSPGNKVASFIINATFNNNGTLVLVGTDVIYTPESTLWNASVNASSTNIVFQVTGSASETVNWKVSVEILTV